MNRQAAIIECMRPKSAPKILDRIMREDYERSPTRDVYAKAILRAREVLETHISEPSHNEACKAVRPLVDEADAEQSVENKEK